jgi:hypothetical protein
VKVAHSDFGGRPPLLARALIGALLPFSCKQQRPGDFSPGRSVSILLMFLLEPAVGLEPTTC